ncbi:MAG: ArsR/SmtB family transcription factor [Jatrophihabitans sp.]|uniref:ArsR/SmtB family transcription factor n=1 Tax=Jatrophihabitans sp. TaxID=1932789 RepID=UPI003F807CCA
MTPDAEAAGGPVRLTDPAAIRALAHPARLAVIEELYAGRELTATECAAVAGLSPSAMSYHLRSLERAGIVVRAEPTGDGRERPWRAAGTELTVDSSASTLAQAAGNALTATMLGRLAADLEAWSRRRQQRPEAPQWRGFGGITNGTYWLRPDEARAIDAVLRQAAERYRERDLGERPPDARRMRITTFMVPLDEAAQQQPGEPPAAVGSQHDDPA